MSSGAGVVEARYFLLVDSEERTAQACKIYMEPGEDAELLQVTEEAEAQGLDVREVERDYFLYVLARAGISKVEFLGGATND